MPITQEQLACAQQAQHNAAHDTSRVVRLVAGPGTGKSSTIEERICWLLATDVPPESIYVVSFTRASAQDLRQRIAKYCNENGQTNADQVSVSTLHSLCLRVLRAAGLLELYPVDPGVMDQWELDNIYDSEFSCHSGLTPSRCGEVRRQWEAFWSTGTWSPANYMPPDPEISDEERTAFGGFHSPRAQTYSCVLPGEIVRQCVECIEVGNVDPVGILHTQHLVVDEYQDLNTCDQTFVRYFIQQGVPTFIAGDDDQSIYSFRFASPSGLQDLPTNCTDLGDHSLSACFRCTPSVLESATSVIEAHPLPNRIPKTLESLHAEAVPPALGAIHRWQFPDGADEARAIAESCRDLVNAGVAPRDILVLISDRRALARGLATAFDTVGVDYEPPSPLGDKDSDERRMILSLLRIVCDEDGRDYVARRTVLGLLPGVGKMTCHRIANAIIANNLNYLEVMYRPLPGGVFGNREAKALNRARALFASVIGWTSSDVIADRQDEMASLLASELGDAAVQLWRTTIANLPEQATMQELRDYLWADTDREKADVLESAYRRLGLDIPEHGLLPPRVRMMTMHGAKGLSACVVFIPGMEEEVFPGPRRRLYPGLILEAARLLYVSISRARAACVVSYANRRFQNGSVQHHSPSRFTRCTGEAFSQRTRGLNAESIASIAECCSLMLPPRMTAGVPSDEM